VDSMDFEAIKPKGEKPLISARVEPDIKARIEEIHKEKGVSKSQIVEAFLKTGLKYYDHKNGTESKAVAVVEKKKPVKRFVKPDEDTALAYFMERGVAESQAEIEAENFINHFTSNGWKVGGKTKMVCWKSAIRNWISRNKVKASKAPQTTEGLANGSIGEW